MNTEIPNFNPTEQAQAFAKDARPRTREAFLKFVAAYDRASAEQNDGPLFYHVDVVRFIENPLELLDLLRGDKPVELRCDTIYGSCGRELAEAVSGWILGPAGVPDEELVFVSPEVIELVRSQLWSNGGGGTPLGGVEFFTL